MTSEIVSYVHNYSDKWPLVLLRNAGRTEDSSSSVPASPALSGILSGVGIGWRPGTLYCVVLGRTSTSTVNT